jgi:dienelactone hydrolase
VLRDPDRRRDIVSANDTTSRTRCWNRFDGAGRVLALAGLAGCVCDPAARILERRGSLVSAVEGELVAGSGHVDQEVALVASSGLEVELVVRRPEDRNGVERRPVALILGGADTGRQAARLVPDTHGIVVAAMSYPTDVRRIGGLADALDVRRAILDTPSAVMLSLDWLLAQPYADPARVELVGVSLGAPFACVAGSLDERVRRVWSIHGGGSPARLIAHALDDELWAPCAWLGGRAIAWLAHGYTLAPERWVAGIAPRELVMVNALDDEDIPRACVELLFAAAREPKELRWLPGGHIDKDDEERIRALCRMVVEAVVNAQPGR